jgi:hypothetical protein
MKRHWQYPIYLIQHGGGYASIVDSDVKGQSHQSLVVCCKEERAIRFMAACGIMGAPRQLNNDREFAWLLKSVQAPVKGVVFDPSASVEAQESALRISVQDLLDKHVAVDNSPWNYPVYVVAQDSGFVSLQGANSDAESVTAIGFFTSEQQVETYLEAAKETGETCAMKNVDEARAFLTVMASQATAVALNPIVVDGYRTAKHCFSIATLLEKYLVAEGNNAEEES